MRIFVGNLAWATTEAELGRLFESYGMVVGVHIVTNHGSKRSMGFGFVEMPDATAAQAAIDGLDGTAQGGRQLTVNEARAREGKDRPRRPRE
jgi:RNA recognition motif-containing protein